MAPDEPGAVLPHPWPGSPRPRSARPPTSPGRLRSWLFWAIRGGGGNFGIVTAFDFVAHPTTDVFFGKIAFPAAEAGTVLRGWADHLRTAPEDLSSTWSSAIRSAAVPSHPSRSSSPSTATTRRKQARRSTRSGGSAR